VGTPLKCTITNFDLRKESVTVSTFLELVRSGKLIHDVMESHDMKVRVYGDTAVVTAQGVSGGQYEGKSFRQ
jgi:hypothetical protein